MVGWWRSEGVPIPKSGFQFMQPFGDRLQVERPFWARRDFGRQKIVQKQEALLDVLGEAVVMGSIEWKRIHLLQLGFKFFQFLLQNCVSLRHVCGCMVMFVAMNTEEMKDQAKGFGVNYIFGVHGMRRLHGREVKKTLVAVNVTKRNKNEKNRIQVYQVPTMAWVEKIYNKYIYKNFKN